MNCIRNGIQNHIGRSKHFAANFLTSLNHITEQFVAKIEMRSIIVNVIKSPLLIVTIESKIFYFNGRKGLSHPFPFIMYSGTGEGTVSYDFLSSSSVKRYVTTFSSFTESTFRYLSKYSFPHEKSPKAYCLPGDNNSIRYEISFPYGQIICFFPSY